jgi:hypothetical protein
MNRKNKKETNEFLADVEVVFGKPVKEQAQRLINLSSQDNYCLVAVLEAAVRACDPNYPPDIPLPDGKGRCTTTVSDVECRRKRTAA